MHPKSNGVKRDFVAVASRSARKGTTLREVGDLARGDVIKHLRKQRHIGQQDIADAVGVRLRTVQLWEAGKGIKWPNAESLGAYLETDPENLVERDGEDELNLRLEQIQSSLARLEEGVEALLAAAEADALPSGHTGQHSASA